MSPRAKPFDPGKLDKLIHTVSEVTGIPPARICSRSKNPETHFARKLIYHIAEKDFRFPLMPLFNHMGRAAILPARERSLNTGYRPSRILLSIIRNKIHRHQRYRQATKNKPPSVVCAALAQRITIAVSALTALPVHVIRSRLRSVPVAFARQLAAVTTLECVRALGVPAPLCDAARAFKIDHGTLSHACRAVRDRCDTDPRARALREQLRKQFTIQTFTDGDGI